MSLILCTLRSIGAGFFAFREPSFRIKIDNQGRTFVPGL